MNTLTRNFTPQENEFLAENEPIQIVPNFRGDKLRFISGTFGPFKPAKPVSVPLWLAIYLKQRKRCDVVVPSWLDVEFLQKVRKEDRETPEDFSNALPYYYAEVASLLLHECEDEFTNAAQVKSVLEDISETRKEKLNRLLKRIDPATPVHYLGSVGSLELNTLRAGFQAAYGAVTIMQ